VVSAVIGDWAVTKTVPGTMELTATSPYAGDTTINQGTLLVNGTLTNSLVRLSCCRRRAIRSSSLDRCSYLISCRTM
jgi:autotransporter-associated beta strand protein